MYTRIEMIQLNSLWSVSSANSLYKRGCVDRTKIGIESGLNQDYKIKDYHNHHSGGNDFMQDYTSYLL